MDEKPIVIEEKAVSRRDFWQSERVQELLFLAMGLFALIALCFFVAHHTLANLLQHSPFDSYTLQAMAWREGHIALSDNYPWLELAIYEGQYYVSFPPVPALPMLFLSFFFGENTPSALVTLAYFLGAYVAAYYLLRRTFSPGQSMAFALFVMIGGSILDLAVSGEGFAGGVWYQAQLLSLLLTLLSFLLMGAKRKGAWAASLVCIALAVGCRPFNALYAPVLLMMLYQNLTPQRPALRIGQMVPYIIAPALIAIAYAAYNYVRFGNLLEFGHNYLPEYTESGDPIFGLSFLQRNIGLILRPFQLEDGLLTFPILSGFAVYATNPMMPMGAARTLYRATTRRADWLDVACLAAVIVQLICLLAHRTLGGWQYGTRYLADAVPALLFLYARGERRQISPYTGVLMGGLMLLNVYGTILFHAMSR